MTDKPLIAALKLGARKPKRNSNVMRAAILCKEKAFQTFLRTQYPEVWSMWGDCESEGEQDDENWTVLAMRTILGIDSRKDLAAGQEALKRFDELVAKYEMWKKGE